MKTHDAQMLLPTALRQTRQLNQDQSMVGHADSSIKGPAQYHFAKHEMFVNPDLVDSEHQLYGFVAHEMGHARWSKWRLELVKGTVKVDRQTFATMEMLDEVRIERRVYDVGLGEVLRASFSKALELILASIGTPEGPNDALGLSHLWALCYGRYLANIASKADVEPIDILVRAQLGDDVVDAMFDIMGEFTVVDDVHKMKALAAEWNALLGQGDGTGEPGEGEEGVDGEDAEGTHGESSGKGKGEKSEDESEDGEGSGSGAGDEGDEDESEGGGSGEGSGDEGEDEGTGKGAQSGDADDDSDGECGKGAAESIDGDGGSDAKTNAERDLTTDVTGDGESKLEDAPEVEPGRIEWDEELTDILQSTVKNLAEETKKPLPVDTRPTLADPRKVSPEIFGGKAGKYAPYEEVPVDNTILAMAQSFTRELENIVLPTIKKTPKAAVIPPGRLRSRDALRKSAEHSMGLMSHAEPWRMTKKTRTAGKPVTVGIMTDVSGSMGWAEKFVARFTYVVGLASVRVGARAAAVTFGTSITATLKPGEVPHKLRVVPANQDHEEFDHAVAALDGVLNLTVNDGKSKLLFIVTDGQLVKNGEMARAAEWCKRLHEAGTTIVWIEGERKEFKLPGVIHVKARPNMSTGDDYYKRYSEVYDDDGQIKASIEGEVFRKMAKEITKAMQGEVSKVR